MVINLIGQKEILCEQAKIDRMPGLFAPLPPFHSTANRDYIESKKDYQPPQCD
jgi:hypothetical protein